MTEKFTYSKTIENLSDAFVKVIYDDESIVEPLSKNYDGLTRTGLKSAVIVSKDGKPLYTLNIVNDKLIYRKRSLAKGVAGSDTNEHNMASPKRCIILATEGKVVFFWDSKEIVEHTSWQSEAPYNTPKFRKDEN